MQEVKEKLKEELESLQTNILSLRRLRLIKLKVKQSLHLKQNRINLKSTVDGLDML